ncbi:glycosyltransferase family A protein [Magnetospirillum molischianum]|uniref:glycosyltransferase family A protein n=1 Tax=Magnetospirillum molischianum TaxID=1083 RepID=UPI0012DDBAF1|nr:glycosyltransferase family A protein [Magnetospirillum molischianum]
MKTKPLVIQEAPLRIVSMVSHADVLMYLVAVKSFYSVLKEGRIVVLDDGSLTDQDRAVLSDHLNPDFRLVADVDTGSLPRGGCWERLLTVLDLARESYVIQLDSDTLTIAPLPEISACWTANRSFTLGTRLGQAVVGTAEAKATAQRLGGDHIQVLAEQTFADRPETASLRYIRGSAGFAGFAQGDSPHQRLETVSTAMSAALGARWSDWGSEQVASNIMVANSADPAVLPLSRYACYDADMPYTDKAFLHFIGSHRFHNGVYTRLTRQIIAQLARR